MKMITTATTTTTSPRRTRSATTPGKRRVAPRPKKPKRAAAEEAKDSKVKSKAFVDKEPLAPPPVSVAMATRRRRSLSKHAIAELLDNAVDEVHNGASFVNVDKFVNLRDHSAALLIQDDGGGMDPESLRRCMSFGFSDKQSESFIGQYGIGFKTSTMRLGADVIVFSRCRKNMYILFQQLKRTSKN